MDSAKPFFVILTALWLGYFVIHSLLASLWLKEKIEHRHPKLMPAYRLAYNGLAAGLLIPPLWLTFSFSGPWLWRWQGPWFWVANALASLAIAGIFWSLHYYDSREFLGVRQWQLRQASALDQERFHISPLHRYVRHPWYSLTLVILWTRDMNAAWLTTVGLVTAYFILGSRLEENKLIRYHGRVYEKYREQVPGLLPLPWRFLSRQSALELENSASRPN
jgi:protein-S-isoprenylcysteine O-methyltransferase Ste14